MMKRLLLVLAAIACLATMPAAVLAQDHANDARYPEGIH